ncbi:MAG: sulfatase [Spirochaetales bacterium]|jgi:arylsulfatase A|nr:sulfatase [Spirochaetales bacterium]
MRKPNVIFILADDLGWGEPGCYGNRLNETPNIDALAASGIRFTSAYASSTVCSPSRAGLMTGQTPPRNGITDYLRPDAEWFIPLTEGGFSDNELPEDTDYHLDRELVTLPQMFKKCGYATGMIGKWHLSGYDENGVKHGPEKYGFDDVLISEQVGIGGGSYFHPYDRVDPHIATALGENEFLVDRMNHEANEYIKKHKDQPFFLYLSHYAVHTHLAGKKEYIDYFSRKARLTNISYAAKAELPEENPVLAAMLKSIDDGVGLIRETLKDLGIERDTIIIFTSDNGGETRVTVNGHLRDGKSSTYEGGLRVSLVMDYPGVTSPGTVTDVPTINLDFYSTFAEILGYDIPKEHITDGVSILPLLRGDRDVDAISQRLFSWHYPLDEPHFLGGRSSAANRKSDYKYIRFFDDGSDELYNLREDESEKNNLVDRFPERTQEHQVLLRNWIREVKGIVPEGQHGLG